MKFTVITILPELIEPALTAGVVGRAKQAGTISVACITPREFTHDKHRTVDDTPYGGGPGMVMKPEPLLAAISRAGPRGEVHRILLSPGGAPLTQARVRELAAKDHLVLVCGRYEGVDQRVIDAAIDEEISIGDYVLSGGELGALVIIDAVSRLVPGVLGDQSSAEDESFSAGLLEYPQYTRPAELDLEALPLGSAAAPGQAQPPEGGAIPPVLAGGNHAVIAAWRRLQAMQRTATRRPELWKKFRQTKADRVAFPPLASRTHLALVHHPVVDRLGKVITTALTNFDIHDLARSSMTYGLAALYLVTPVTSQRDKAEHIAKLWMGDDQGEHRARALELVRTADSIDTVLEQLTARYGQPPRVVATSAKASSFPGAARRLPADLVSEFALDPAPMLVLLGTGWGLADSLIPSVSRVLTPIEGATDWNHLSVRSAGAVLLDRLFGRVS